LIFTPGEIVQLKSNAAIRGAVISTTPGTPENRINVYIDGKIQTFYASQLKVEDRVDDDSALLPCEAFHANLTAHQLQYPGLSTLYSLNAARIDFIPYQFRPVLRFIRSDRPRLLIADGVGVGKTIEAGLILKELQARREIHSVLIICPRPLVTERKWEIEMRRFEERFVPLNGASLRYCIQEMDLEGVWPEQYNRVIIPYSLFDETLLYGTGRNEKLKTKRGLLELDPPPRFDLVIVDEAHHIRNRGTFSHKAVRFFCDHAEAVVFLTATPIQLGNHDLFVLLNTLRPDLIIDEESFEHMAEPNPFINQAVSAARARKPGWTHKANAALERAAQTPWGQSMFRHNSEFARIHGLISEGKVELDERVQLITDLESLHTFSGIINRTRRRDIGDFTIRRPETVVVEFTEAQKTLHDRLLEVQASVFARLHGNANVKFMMTTIRRQAASCLFGLLPFLQEILSRHLDELSWEEADNTGFVQSGDPLAGIESDIQTILEVASKLDAYDPKLEALRKIIRDKQNLQNNKLMLFSSFRHTLNYLYQHLLLDGFRVGFIHGGTPDEDRLKKRLRFEMPRDEDNALDVLLFSEIGCEGLDYQFCDCIVNYDLPWNPMRVEQRVGRIDRNGQKSETIAIYNLITPGTVDADIYDRCLLRIGVFNHALGESEEILGEITRQIRNIAENLSLSEAERQEQFQQLADNKIRLLQEEEELEQKQLELFGIRLPQDQLKQEIEASSSFWLSPRSLLRLIELYLQSVRGKEQAHILGEKALKTLRLSHDSRTILLRDFQKLPRQRASAYRDWEKWLKGGDPHLLITFDATTASERPDAAFITPLHPLVKQAATASERSERATTALMCKSNQVPQGSYEFVMYQWQFHGVKEDIVLQPVATSEKVTDHLAELLETAEDDLGKDAEVPDKEALKNLDAQHHKRWAAARAEHQRRTRELAAYRQESLTTSHRARMLLLKEQLAQAINPKIKKMRQSQIVSADADYTRRIGELEAAKKKADLTAEPIAYGVIRVEEAAR